MNLADTSTSIDDVVTVLMVAEKPSIARSIAEALGGSGFATRKGICKFTNVFTFQGALFGKVKYPTCNFIPWPEMQFSQFDHQIKNNALEITLSVINARETN